MMGTVTAGRPHSVHRPQKTGLPVDSSDDLRQSHARRSNTLQIARGHRHRRRPTNRKVTIAVVRAVR